MVKRKIDEKSCGIVTFRQTSTGPQFLILKYPGGHLGFPKGHVEDNETEHETAKRELEEETGISDVEILEGYREEITYRFNNQGQMSNKLVVFFIGETKTEEVKISHEHSQFFWASYDEALKKVTFENSKQLLRKARSMNLV